MMLMNLFSVFDPSSYYGIPLNWIIIFMVLCLVSMKYFLIGSVSQKMVKKFSLEVEVLFKEIAGNNGLAITFICVTSFLYIGFSNLIGLFPFTFTSTAHPIVTLGMSLVLWTSFFMMGWIKNFNHSAAHLVPEGSPVYLSPLMVMIESISHLMRPFTLAIRLAANMMSGHLIISLLSSISLLSMLGFLSSLTLQTILLILEIGVAIIQSFVFSILVLLYALEYY